MKNQVVIRGVFISTFVLGYIFISVILNVFLGDNTKNSMIPIIVILACLLLLFIKIPSDRKNISIKNLEVFLLAVIFLNIVFFLTGKVVQEGELFKTLNNYSHINFNFKMIVAAISVLLAASFRRFKIIFRMLLAFFFLLLLSVYFIIPILYPTPDIDLYIILKNSLLELSNHKNPYHVEYKDIYNGAYDYSYHKQKIKLVYWPLNLYLLYPFEYFFNDLRYAYLFFLLSGTVLLGVFARNIKVFLFSFFLIFTNPYTFYMIKYGWIDTLAFPFFILCFYFFEKRKWIWMFFVLGLLASLKLYFVFLVPIFILQFFKSKDFSVTKTLGALLLFSTTFLATMLPYLFADLEDMVYTLKYFSNSSPRYEALSVVSYIFKNFNTDTSLFFTIFSLLLIVFSYLWNIFNNKNDIDAVCRTMIIVLLSIFVFSKQSFGNYYYNILMIAVVYIVQYFWVINKNFTQTLKDIS